MPLGTTPYPVNPLAQMLMGLGDAMQGAGPLIQGIKAFQGRNKTIGDLLGYQQTPAGPATISPLNPVDVRPKYAREVLGPQVPLTVTPKPAYAGAPDSLQPILGSKMRDLERVSPTILSSILGTVNPKSAMDMNSLFYDPTSGAFSLTGGDGMIPTSPRKASVIQRQVTLLADIKNKDRLAAWRSAAEARMKRGGISAELRSGLQNDIDMLKLRTSEGFDELDDQTKSFIDAQTLAALSRIQRYGVNPTKEVTRKTDQTYRDGGANPRDIRFQELKTRYPNMNDEDIMTMMAMEE